MRTTTTTKRFRSPLFPILRHAPLLATLMVFGSLESGAKQQIRNSFFTVYPNAVGSPLEFLSDGTTRNCGLCHYDAINGGGTRNRYGNAIASYGGLNQETGRQSAITNAGTGDQDGDGWASVTEITLTDPLYTNTPTFPGWSAANVSDISPDDQEAHFLPYLTPSIETDTTPPEVTLLTPNGGEEWTANQAYTVTWTATDASGIAAIHLYESLDGGDTYSPIIFGLDNTGSYSWKPANRPSTTARIRIVAIDDFANNNSYESDADYSIVSPAGGIVPTTLRDFDMPGSQPFEGGPEAADPTECAVCHGDYNPAVEPYRNWQGSMMAQASIDPLFLANMTIANQDAPESGDLCLRCHDSRGWLEGRSVPTDASSMEEADLIGVSCDLCHRMVDPVYQEGVSPLRDATVLADLRNPGTEYGNGMFVLDPSAIQRGPFDDAATPHQFVESPFHREAAFCGTCHDVSNPAFTKNPSTGVYELNDVDTPVADISPHSMGPVERTYSEWLNSEYNSETGVHQPEFAGNKGAGTSEAGYVSTCQDCHMRDVIGKGCNLGSAEVRPNLPLHDMTGGSTWLPNLLPALFPERIDADETAALLAGTVRARYMIQNAADLEVDMVGGDLVVKVINQTGHKLPTGYPEGRRIWINVKFFGAGDALLSESGAYEPSTGVLTHDPEVKIYEVHPGIGENIAGDPPGGIGLPAGPSLHFVLNNKIYEDNRIPPRGFTNEAFAEFGGAPVGHSYANYQFWDDTPYAIPAGTVRAEVRLNYQSTSKEFIEFLRDENTTDSLGDDMYDLWNNNGKCPPELMGEASLPIVLDPDLDQDLDGMPNGFENLYGLNPFAAADALSDPDLDGLTCLEECAYGSDPTDPASANRPSALEVPDSGSTYLALRYIRSMGLTTTEITAAVSVDLLSWDSDSSNTTIFDITDNGDGTETVVLRRTTPISDAPKDFMRLEVSAVLP